MFDVGEGKMMLCMSAEREGIIVGGIDFAMVDGGWWSYCSRVEVNNFTDYEIRARELNKRVADVLITSDGRKTDGRSEFEVELELRS